jgi:hypothetical protein
MATTSGSKPGVKALDREVARVPKTRIGEGAKPKANTGTEHINPVPEFGSSKRGRQPEEHAMKSQVNSLKKGRNNPGAKTVAAGTFAAKRAAIRGKKN